MKNDVSWTEVILTLLFLAVVVVWGYFIVHGEMT